MITGLWQRGGGPSEMGFDELANARNDGATDFESDYSIQLIDDGGTVLASYPWDVEVDRQWGPYRYVPERVAIGVKVAFPLETARVRFVRSGTITAEFDPLSSALRDLVHALPDRAFVKNATERRTALLNKIDAFEKMVAKGDLKGGEESLIHDIRDKVTDWVVEVPILATPERTRSALLVQIASIDARLQKRLALSQKRH